MTKKQLAQVFNEWSRQYKADPKRFSRDGISQSDYGKNAAETFERIRRELKL